MSDTECEKEVLCLKVMINKEKTKVLFAEAYSHFTDVLLSILLMPLGNIVSTLEYHYEDEVTVFGSLTTLYRSIEEMEDGHFNDTFVLDPNNSSQEEWDKLKLKADAYEPAMKYTQRKDTESCKKKPKSKTTNEDGVFAKKTASFVISDDLRIVPVVPESILQTLLNVGVTDTNGAELKTVTFGFNEIKDLLWGSLLSETPLTDIILNKITLLTRNCVTANLLHHMEKKLALSSTTKMSLKAIVQKSTNKFLTAQAGKDFTEFLCSLLFIPLGAVEHLLRGKTCLKNIDNMYRSIANINGDRYLKSKDTKTMLLKPKIESFDMPRNHILPLVEEGLINDPPQFMDLVKGEATYSITDDLTITPFCFSSTFSILSGLKIPLSDVKEMDLQIGVEETMNILKAALTSTSALTDGLINPLLKKQPKQEC